MKKKVMLVALTALLTSSCSSSNKEVKTEIPTIKIIETKNIKSSSSQLYVVKVVSIVPVRKRRVFYIVKSVDTKGKIYKIQIDSAYLVNGLNFSIGSTLKIYGTAPYKNTIVPMKILNTKNNLIYYFSPDRKTAPLKK